jgi:hypothetical protein
VCGQHVGPAQAEDQEHFRGPRADTANFGELINDVPVVHPVQGRQAGQDAAVRPLGEIPYGRDFRAGESDAAQLLIVGC